MSNKDILPVLSDEQIYQAILNATEVNDYRVLGGKLMGEGLSVAQAQRDADREYMNALTSDYEELRLADRREYERKLSLKEEVVTQRVRQETARKLIKEIEATYPRRDGLFNKPIASKPVAEWWQSIKARYGL